MAKAINWPKTYRDEILQEDTERTFSAVRLGRLYYDGRYWVPDEEVDIRCNHLKLRRAVIRGELRCCPVGDLDNTVLGQLKSDLQTHERLIQFLSTTYNQPVDQTTEVTVVSYQNLPVNPALVEVASEDTSGRHL